MKVMGDEVFLVHICLTKDWAVAQENGIYKAESLENEGFIHCSRPDQVLTVANRLYQDLTDLVLLWIDPERVESEIRWEAADGDVFPHIYGPLQVEAVVAVSEFTPDSDGVYRTLPKP
jgi:uncharacterized protein (DUF952 family)